MIINNCYYYIYLWSIDSYLLSIDIYILGLDIYLSSIFMDELSILVAIFIYQ